MFKRPTNSYSETQEPLTPFQRAGQAWDERIGSARVQARNWRIMAFSCLLFCVILVAALIWQANQSIITPYVVEVSETGQTRSVGLASQTYHPTDAQISYHLADFIKNIRSISIDPVIVRENWLAAYSYATDQGDIILNQLAMDINPFASIGEKSTSVEIVSIVRTSKQSFEVRWRETSFDKGQKVDVSYFTGSIAVVIESPKTTEHLRQNPLGIYVHGLNWSKDHIAQGDAS